MLQRLRPLAGRGIYLSGHLYRNTYHHPHRPQLSALVLLRFSSSERSKVEETLRMLREDIEGQQTEEAKKKQLIATPIVKPPILTRIKNELLHYYHGFRLLVLETRLSAKYVWYLATGRSLMRRERQQLIRTLSDMFRLVPFSFFIIVPFMELALPIFIKLFPNMLPSTFQEASREEEKIRRQLKGRMEMAKFLQDTLEEIALERKTKAAADKNPGKESKAYEFSQFLKKIRKEGGYVSNQDLFKYTKLFEDELTLDSLSMSQLRALCRILSVAPLGTPEILRFQLNMKLRDLKADDKLIAAEGGVDALSKAELVSTCRARGMRALGVSEERLRAQLKQWLELSLSDKVPPSLLLLSRALYLPEEISFNDRLRTILSSLPDELGEQTRQKLSELEGAKIDPKARMELIRQIEEGLERERKAEKEKVEKLAADKEREREKEAVEAREMLLDVTEEAAKQDLKTKEAIIHLVTDPSADAAAAVASHAPAPAPAPSAAQSAKAKKEPKLNQDVLGYLEDILHGNPVEEAKHDITDLKEKVIEHTEDLIQVGSVSEEFEESKVAKRIRSRVNTLISGMDTLVAKLENERRNIKEHADPSAVGTLLESDATKIVEMVGDKSKSERLVKIKALLNSLTKLKTMTNEASSQRIEEVLQVLDADTDGIVDANLVLEVLEILGKHKEVEINATQMKKIVEMLKKEDAIEALEALEATQRGDNNNGQEQRLIPNLPTEEEEFPLRSMASPFPKQIPQPPPTTASSEAKGPPPSGQ